MAISVTTLSAAIGSGDTSMTVASATGFTAKTTVAVIGNEMVEINAVNSTTMGVMRGSAGTQAVAHPIGAVVMVGAPGDFQALGFFFNQGQVTQFMGGSPVPSTFPQTVTTAGAVTYSAGQVLSGMILRDPNGAARTDVLPTAALLVAGLPGAQIGSYIDLFIRNDADAAETITMSAGTGGTVTGGGTMTVAQSNAKTFRIRFTGVALGSEAYIVYSLGTVVF